MEHQLENPLENPQKPEEDLFEGKARYKFLADKMPLGVYIINSKGRIIYSNNELQHYIYGKSLTSSQLSSFHYKEIVDESFLPTHQNLIKTLFLPTSKETNRPPSFLAKYKRPDKSTFDAQISMLKTNWKGNTAIIVYVKDIQEIVNKDGRLKNTINELDSFISIVAHDFKAPLSNINTLIGFIARAFKNNDYSTIESDIKKASQNIRLMFDRFDGLTEFARIREGDYRFEAISLINVISKVKSTVIDQMPQALQKKIEITTSNLPTIQGIRVFIELLIQNLLQNSINYFDPKKEKIKINILSRSINQYAYRIDFSDNGIGIHPRIKDQIFLPFKRGSNSTGKGLGLAIVKKIIEIHGGNIWIESSNEETGTTFSFTIKRN